MDETSDSPQRQTADFGCQAGKPFATLLTKETYNEVLTMGHCFDRILPSISPTGL